MANVKLRDRNDKVGIMSLEMVEQMVEKLLELREMRKDIVKQRTQEILDVKRKYTKRIDNIEKDIYNFENSIKQLAGRKELNYMLSKLREQQEKDKSKDLNRSNPQEDDNDNNKNNEEAQ